MRHAEEVTSSVASALGLSSDQVLIASTGVIGRLYPIDNIRAGIASLPFRPRCDKKSFERAQSVRWDSFTSSGTVRHRRILSIE
jgi:N-acetylglutamate synthase/N-acetylornithine aminotransferase